jgi:predicted PolB exonuclease-like 3'-5' exonuclease
MNILTFDIETVPDVEAGRKLYALHGLSDKDVAKAMAMKRREESGDSDFLRHYLHRVVAISVVLRQANSFNVWSLGETASDEPELIRRFFEGIERFTPTLVSWNGSGFDLPVLHYRMLRHRISAPRYWETGADDQSFRWNNYLSRYHERHTDLMDVLSGYQPRASAPLEAIARLLDLPGKLGQSGANVWDQFQAGEIEHIRNYCETDALNTYLVYLHYELMRGNLDEPGYRRETAVVRDFLKAARKPHFDAFLAAWR